MVTFIIGIISGLLLILHKETENLKLSNVIIPYIIGLLQAIAIIFIKTL